MKGSVPIAAIPEAKISSLRVPMEIVKSSRLSFGKVVVYVCIRMVSRMSGFVKVYTTPTLGSHRCATGVPARAGILQTLTKDSSMDDQEPTVGISQPMIVHGQ